ncbi:MAG: DUF1570 domain-containing protein [Chlorobi bacterium]|nr:DUF1570 domain-containing protein [Chlorobiota bacterium]MCI0716806.1 DUF1570 domain-containing protein [Chlorobiota bacterium]
MAKKILIFLYIALAILLGYSLNDKADIKPDEQKPTLQDSLLTKTDVKNNLSELEETFENYDYQSVIKKYSGKVPENFSITRFKYFVVFSDLDEDLTYRLIDSDVRNTIDAMQNSFVNVNPDNVTPIFLFNDLKQYKEFVIKNFEISKDNISQYGFYKISKNVIVIRYVSWKGSISHEITHRFTNSDFPDMPSWFDEGLASLHEKSTYNDGRLIGDFSWRILAIRRAIKENRYTKLEKMMKTGDDELYGKYSSFYYAQARYLLMYLQDKGLLENYYKLFKETYKTDETGINQLEKILGKPMDKINEDHYSYLMSFKH